MLPAVMFCRFVLQARPNWGAFFLFLIAFNFQAGEVSEVFSKAPYLQVTGSNTISILWECPTQMVARVRYALEAGPEQIVPATFFRRVQSVTSTHLVVTNPPVTNLVAVVPKHEAASTPASPPAVTNAPASVEGTNAVTKPTTLRVSHTNFYYVYQVPLTHLRPGGRYTYSVELGQTATPPKSFRAFAPEAELVHFIAYGDTRSHPKIHTAIAQQFRAHDPDFILHTGDLVNSGHDYKDWSKEFFLPLTGVIDEVPLLPVFGNHEDDGTNFLAYFPPLGGHRWYSFDHGPVHVLALDYHYDKAKDKQFAFASQDLLQSRAPWKIVFLHYPMFNLGGHDSAWGHAAYLPLFHRAKVDVVIAGHSHLYERFHPVAPKDAALAWPILHLTSGGGGADLDKSPDHPALVKHATTNHFLVFDVAKETLRARALNAAGQVLDTFTLSKPQGRLTPEYLAEVYPEETLQLTHDAGDLLQGKLPALPASTNAAPIMFTLHSLAAVSESVPIEISLATNSLPYYELEGGVLRTSTPARGEANRFVWAAVRPTGKKKITEGGGRELSPPLVFLGKIKTGEFETRVTGAKSRLSVTASNEFRKTQAKSDSAP